MNTAIADIKIRDNIPMFWSMLHHLLVSLVVSVKIKLFFKPVQCMKQFVTYILVFVIAEGT